MDPFPQDAGASDAADYNDAVAADQARITGALEWIRGYIGDGTTTVRNWWLGDPLHSRPVTINYGIRTAGFSTTNPDIRIVFGTNDGLFHMFQNTLSSSQSAPLTDGMENWAFAPKESMDVWDRLRQNTQNENPLHPLTVDGSTAVWANDVNGDSNLKTSDSDEVWAFFGMRRGGKSYYALDITDPDDPRFMWRISKYTTPYTAGYDTTPAIDSDFEELGLTFSTPVVGQMSIDTDNDPGTPNETVTVLVFGGGYNGDDGGDNLVDDDASANWNDTTASTGANFGKDQINRDFNLDNTLNVGEEDYDANTSEGNAIFIVNAETGALIWKAGRIDGGNTSFNATSKKLGVPDMEDSIPSEPAAVDTTGNGFLDRVYVGDTGGRVWRFDIANSLPDNWTATLMLNAGRHVTSDLDNDRRFFNRPDVVQTVDDTGPYDAVLIGSGDRENPNMAENEDAFFLIKDRAITSGSPSATNYSHDTSTSSLADLTSDDCAEGNVSCDTTNLANGWFIDLGLGSTNTGQKNLSAALTLGGIVFFSTFAPDATGCGVSEGTGRQYALSLQDATAAFNFDDSSDGSFERFDALESGGIPVEPVSLGDDVLLFQGQGGDDGDVDGDGDVDDDDAALADLDNLRAIGVRTSWTTYWYELEN